MFVYDGYNCCYTVGELPFQSNVELAVNITDDETGNCMEKVYTVRIEKLDDYSELPMVNATLKYKAWISGIKISKFTFSSTFGLIRMVNGLERRLGYFQNARSTQTGPFLNFDISVGSFYPSVLLTEFVKNYLHVPDGGFLAQDFYKVQLEKALIGVYVETIHRQEGKLTYRIKGISNDPMSEIRFHVPAEGTQKTIIEYFHANYNCELKYVSWPCVVSGADSRPIYLPMEVCKIVVGQRCDQMVTTILSPNERKKHIKESFMENIYNDEYARQFGINLSNQMVYLKARVLPPPKLACIKAGAYTTFEPRGGRWNMKEMKSVTGQSVQRWAILNLSNKVDMFVSSFIRTVIRACTDIGMVFNIDDVVKPKPPGSVPIECALRKLDESVKEVTSGLQLQLLFVILPEANSSSCYGEIKKVCDTELGITSQCFLPKHVPKPQMKRPEDYFFHVALKINVKVGGCNTYVEDVMSGFDASIMIFGADVSHPRPGDTSSPSIAAVVGSLDYPQVSQYRCVTSVQDGVEEIIHDLRSMVKELLNAFKQANNHLPHRIVFFRDGVAESRYGEVWNYEVQEISKACESFQKLHIPVTFVLVLKRHHTRLFLDKENKNVYPGTVLDNTICLPDEFDFFLCSHACSVGTAKPPHYIVLHDENGFTADAIHELTSKLTYGYVRSTRALSIVTPVQYAHLAAARARHYIGPSSSVGPLRVQENIAGTMFFC